MASEATKRDEPSQTSFKQQLDQKADIGRTNDGENSSIVNKITEYIPAAANVVGKSSSNESLTNPGPPFRPDHDDKIEDFVRDQHRCNTSEELLAESKQ